MDMRRSRRMQSPLGMIAGVFAYALRLCLALCLVAAAVQAGDYEVKLRLVNGKTGGPIPDWEVVLRLRHDPPLNGEPPITLMRAKTSADGVAEFRLSEPLPKTLAFGAWDLIACSHGPPHPTNDVLEHGVVAENLCDKKGRLKGKIVAKPGEVVIFAAPYPWWRRLIPIK